MRADSRTRRLRAATLAAHNALRELERLDAQPTLTPDEQQRVVVLRAQLARYAQQHPAPAQLVEGELAKGLLLQQIDTDARVEGLRP